MPPKHSDIAPMMILLVSSNIKKKKKKKSTRYLQVFLNRDREGRV